MLNQIQIQPESVEDLKRKFHTLQECFERGIPFGVTGSPLSTLLMVQSDFLAILKEVIKENKGERRNSELIFEEFENCPSSEEGFLDIENDQNYKPSLDALGNPLQVQIDLGKSYQFTSEESLELAEFIELLEKFFAIISLGGTPKVKNILEVLKPIISSNRRENTLPKLNMANESKGLTRREWRKIIDQNKIWINNSIPQNPQRQVFKKRTTVKEGLPISHEIRKKINEEIERSPRSHIYKSFHMPKISRSIILDIVDMTPNEIMEYEESIKRLRSEWHSNK
jgi:hypothetical protein